MQSPFAGQLTLNDCLAEFAPDVPCKWAVVTINFPVDEPSCDPWIVAPRHAPTFLQVNVQS